MQKPDNYFLQSGVIPFRIKDEKLEVLLITSRKKKKWIIPKGIIETGMKPYESAAHEALEEAGVIGEVSKDPVGSYKLKKWDGICEVLVYPMKVENETTQWMEDSFRERKWFSIEGALEVIERNKIKKLIKELRENLFPPSFSSDK